MVCLPSTTPCLFRHDCLIYLQDLQGSINCQMKHAELGGQYIQKYNSPPRSHWSYHSFHPMHPAQCPPPSLSICSTQPRHDMGSIQPCILWQNLSFANALIAYWSRPGHKSAELWIWTTSSISVAPAPRTNLPSLQIFLQACTPSSTTLYNSMRTFVVEALSTMVARRHPSSNKDLVWRKKMVMGRPPISSTATWSAYPISSGVRTQAWPKHWHWLQYTTSLILDSHSTKRWVCK